MYKCQIYDLTQLSLLLIISYYTIIFLYIFKRSPTSCSVHLFHFQSLAFRGNSSCHRTININHTIIFIDSLLLVFDEPIYDNIVWNLAYSSILVYLDSIIMLVTNYSLPFWYSVANWYFLPVGIVPSPLIFLELTKFYLYSSS